MGPLSGAAGWSLPKVFPQALEVALVASGLEREVGWCRPNLPRARKPDLVPGRSLRGVIIFELQIRGKDEYQARVCRFTPNGANTVIHSFIRGN